MFNFTKGQGGEIVIRFTEELVGDVTGIAPYPTNGYEERMTNKGLATTSNQYSATYSADKAFDDKTSTYWQTRLALPQWLQIELVTPIAVNKFRWYIGGSNRPNGFELQGSNDGSTFTTIYTGSSTNTTGWKDFNFDNSIRYKYYKWNITSRYSSYVDIYEIELYYMHPLGNEKAFAVSGKQYEYINGALVDKIYQVVNVKTYAEDKKCVLLTFDTFSRFSTVEGSLTVSYDASKGNLAGAGGAVASFTREFTPQDLIPEPNPHITENVSVAPSIEIDFMPIDYVNSYETENISVAPSIEIEFINVAIINP